MLIHWLFITLSLPSYSSLNARMSITFSTFTGLMQEEQKPHRLYSFFATFHERNFIPYSDVNSHNLNLHISRNLVFYTLWEILFIINIFKVREGMVQFIWKHIDSCFSADVISRQFLDRPTAYKGGKEVKFMQDNFICTINKMPFLLKIFQEEKGLFYSNGK